MEDTKNQNDRGLKRKNDPSGKSKSPKFRRSLAVVIGIDRYSNGIPPLSTAVNDARRLAEILEEEHGYEVTLLTDEGTTLSRLEKVFTEDLPKKLGKNDRLLVYFAGHGVATDGDDGPEGFLIPQDATLEEKTFWPMTDLHEALEKLKCRHMLAILDCCFAGTFRWSSKRDFQPLPSVIHKERYERFIRSRAWQAITSAAYNQKALDVLSGKVLSEHGGRQQQPHSPFALSLFEALHGAADLQKDGVVTATELYLYLRKQVEVSAEQKADHRQTPGLWPLNRHEYGEFVFLLRPEDQLELPSAPELTEQNNPYKGLSPYEKGDNELFFGRTALVKKLKRRVAKLPFTVVLGASGTGKSSLVKAGLLPALEHNANNEKQSEEVKDTSKPSSWFILERVTEKDGKKKKEVMRPGANPLNTLRRLLINDLPGVRPERKEGATPAGMIGQWRKKNPEQKLLLVIDQFEELITLCREDQAREDFIRELRQALEEHSKVLRIVLTLRSDFEAQISQNYLKDCWRQNYRFVVPPMAHNELREVIEKPASLRVLYFEPRKLVDDLINEVIQTPGSLPLLSFTLSELYRRYVERQKDVKRQDGNRALTKADYEDMGGIIGSLRSRIEHKYKRLNAAQKKTLRRILLRMVAFEGGELTRRQAPEWEFTYPSVKETKEVKKLLKGLTKNRLIIVDERKDSTGKAESYYEAVHDSLIVAWDKMFEWRDKEGEKMLLHRQLTQAAADWRLGESEKERKALLWDNSPRLLRVQEFLEQESFGDTEDGTKVERKPRSFRLLRQFCKNLCPSFEPLEQHVWLNRVETDFVRWSIERKRNWVRGVTGIIVVVIVVLAAAWWITNDARIEAENARDVADEERKNAVEKEREAKRNLVKSYSINSMFARKENRLLHALHYMAKAAREGNFISKADYRLFYSIFHEIIVYNNRIPYKVATNLIADKHNYKIKFYGNKIIGLRGEINDILSDEDNVVHIMFNKKKDRILTIDQKGIVKIWNTDNGIRFGDTIKLDIEVHDHCFINNGSNVLSWKDEGVAEFWDAKTGRLIEKVPLRSDKPEEIIGVILNDNGNRMFTWDKEGITTLWNIDTGTAIAKHFMQHHSGIRGAFFIENKNRLFTWGKKGTVKLWDADTGTAVESGLTRQQFRIKGLVFSNTGKIVLTWNEENATILWNADTGALIKKLDIEHPEGVDRVVFSHDDRNILTWNSNGNTAEIWSTNLGGSTNKKLVDHVSKIYGATFSNDNSKVLIWGSRGSSVKIWNVNDDILADQPIETSIDPGDDRIFSKDGTKMLTWNYYDYITSLWNTDTYKKVRSNIPAIYHDKYVTGGIFNNNGKKLLTWSFTGRTVKLTNLEVKEPVVPPFIIDDGGIMGAVFTSDDSKILTWSRYESTSQEERLGIDKLRLWDIEIDDDFPPRHLLLFVEVATLSTMDESGNLWVLSREQLENRKKKYIQISEEHINNKCKYKNVNFYLQHQKMAWNQ